MIFSMRLLRVPTEPASRLTGLLILIPSGDLQHLLKSFQPQGGRNLPPFYFLTLLLLTLSLPACYDLILIRELSFQESPEYVNYA